MEIQNIRNPRWANATHTLIDCEVDIDVIDDEFVPFTASMTDLPHSVEVFERCVAGEFGPISEYVEPPPPASVIPSTITMRQARLQLLANGKLDEVSAAVETMGAAAKIEWEYASDIQRTNPLIPAMQALLGWDEARTNDYFKAASLL